LGAWLVLLLGQIRGRKSFLYHANAHGEQGYVLKWLMLLLVVLRRRKQSDSLKSSPRL